MSEQAHEASWLGQVFEDFYNIDWEVLPAGFRKDMVSWWRERSGFGEDGTPTAKALSRQQQELTAVDLVKVVGYVLSPDLFIEKHGEGQVRFLEVKDVYYAKLLCKAHKIPYQLP